jgi:hypothetical protein
MLGKKYNSKRNAARKTGNWPVSRHGPSRSTLLSNLKILKAVFCTARAVEHPSIRRPLPSRVRVAALSNCSPGIFTATHFDVLVVFVEQLEPAALLV